MISSTADSLLSPPAERAVRSRLSDLSLNTPGLTTPAEAKNSLKTPNLSTPAAASKTAAPEAESPVACAICLSPVGTSAECFSSACCGNQFHRACLAKHKSFASEAARACPLCRSRKKTGLTPCRAHALPPQHRRVAASQPTMPLFRSAAEERTRRELGIPEDEPEEREQLAVLGYGAYAITRLAADPAYGPRSGLSDAARLLRAHDFGLLPAREDLPLTQSVLLEEPASEEVDSEEEEVDSEEEEEVEEEVEEVEEAEEEQEVEVEVDEAEHEQEVEEAEEEQEQEQEQEEQEEIQPGEDEGEGENEDEEIAAALEDTTDEDRSPPAEAVVNSVNYSTSSC